ncbi:MAG: TIGR02266 family protein [Thermodesulfobacteriota bacterium]|nr:TIGR02266 family protein [Thermodesulfobacteriota bacterium]
MLNIASEETYKDSDIIIKEGSSGDWVYIIRSGAVEISKTIGGKKFVIELLQPGEVFGELGFLGGIKRTATARAVGETTVGVLDREFLDQEFNKLYSDFRAILTAVVKRFKKMIDRTSEFSTRGETRILETYSLKYKDKNSFVDAYSGDLSSGGLFIRTGNPLQRGEQFSLRLQLPGIPNSIETKCEVVWARKKEEETDTSPAGMGVKFVEMTKKNNQMLTQFLKDVL